jgi:uncharacterized membrane protein
MTISQPNPAIRSTGSEPAEFIEQDFGAREPGPREPGRSADAGRSTGNGDRTGICASERLEGWVQGIEADERLDPAVNALVPLAETANRGSPGAFLRGQWLGHAFHPLMTDLPLGCWLGAGLLDLVGGRNSRPAARRLVGLGLAFTPLTVASGVADWGSIRERGVQRLGAAHAMGNTVVATTYLASWLARRRGHHGVGVGLGMTAGMLAWATGYLGGHLSFARGVGQGTRGRLRARSRDE